MTTMTVSHTDNLSIAYFDQHDNPMPTTPVPDSAPTWTNAPSTTGVDTLTVDTGGLTAHVAAMAAGTDTVTLTFISGGVTFTATDAITITAEPSVLTRVAIVDDVV